jgi:hypothetical protein
MAKKIRPMRQERIEIKLSKGKGTLTLLGSVSPTF